MGVVAGYHLIWTAYGWWLPNDPRGSTSHEVNAISLQDLGEVHFGRKQFQPSRRVVTEFYREAHGRLRFELLTMSDREVAAIGAALGDVVSSQRYTSYACAIMPDHVHILIRKHRQLAPEMIDRLQAESRQRVLSCGERDPQHPVWTAGGGWKVFLESREEFRRTIQYIERNPIRIGRPQQFWNFVTTYDGWSPGQVTVGKPRG